MCLRELNDAGMMNLQLDNLNDEMEKILVLLRHLSERYFTYQEPAWNDILLQLTSAGFTLHAIGDRETDTRVLVIQKRGIGEREGSCAGETGKRSSTEQICSCSKSTRGTADG